MIPPLGWRALLKRICVAGWVEVRRQQVILNDGPLIYLALFNGREGNGAAALAAINEALKHPLEELPRTDGNKSYLGYNGAVIAFLRNDHGLCLKMCHKLLSDPRQEEFWTASFHRFFAVAAKEAARRLRAELPRC